MIINKKNIEEYRLKPNKIFDAENEIKTDLDVKDLYYKGKPLFYIDNSSIILNDDISIKDEIDNLIKKEQIRNERNIAFELVDKYQGVLIYSSLTVEQQQQLQTYRDELLDCTKTFKLPIKPEWLV